MSAPHPKPGRRVDVGLLQLRASEARKANLDKALRGIGQAAARGAQIVCLQELFASPYFPQAEEAAHFDLAEPVPGPTTEALAACAREHEVVILGPVFERRGAGIYHNTVVVLDADGSLAGRYRKMHIPDDPLYFEKFYFTPGDRGFPVVATRFARIGPLLCWDQWFPEAARLSALAGAEILFYPTAIGWLDAEKGTQGERQYQAWEVVQRSHAIANGLFVAAVNRVGREGGLEFWGGSFVCDPLGQVLARAGHDEEETLVVGCDLGSIEDVRRDWPFLRDRRVDAYGGLTSRFLDA